MPQQACHKRGLPRSGTPCDNHTPPISLRTERQCASVQEHYVVPAHGRTNAPDAYLHQPVGAEPEDRHHLLIPRPPSRPVPPSIKPVAAGWLGQRIQRGGRLLIHPGLSPVGSEHASKPGAIRNEGDDYPAPRHTDRREHPVGKPETGHHAPKAGPGLTYRQERVVVADTHLIAPLAHSIGEGPPPRQRRSAALPGPLVLPGEAQRPARSPAAAGIRFPVTPAARHRPRRAPFSRSAYTAITTGDEDVLVRGALRILMCVCGDSRSAEVELSARAAWAVALAGLTGELAGRGGRYLPGRGRTW